MLFRVNLFLILGMLVLPVFAQDEPPPAKSVLRLAISFR